MKNTQPKKTALYCRLSVDDGRFGESVSIESQKLVLEQYCKDNAITDYKLYCDDGYSGTNFNRPGFQKMFEDIQKGLIDTVICKDLSRLGRHRTQSALFIEHLRMNNVKVYSVTEGIDTTDEDDDLLIGFKQIYNDFYAKDIGRKIRTGIDQKQKKGLVVNLPMGYYKDRLTDEVKVDELAADIVREVYKMFLDGHGLSTIARDMNRRGIKSPEYFSHRKIGAQRTEMCKRFLWAQTTVKRLLTNEIYTGTLVNHKTVTSKIYKTKTVIPEDERYRHEDFVPAIVSKQDFDKVQAVINSRKVGNVRTKGGIIHRYSGMIKCADCGAILIAKRRNWKDTEYIEYTCNSNHRYGKQYCTPHRIHESQLDEIVNSELMTLLDNIKSESEKYDSIVKEWQKNKPKYELRISQYNSRIQVLREQVQAILMERISDKAHSEMYNEMLVKRESEISELQRKIKETQKFDEVYTHKSRELKSTADMLEDILTDPHISDLDLRMLVEKVLVHQNEDKSLDVELVFNGNFAPICSVSVEG